MYDERSTVLRENVFEQSVKKYISVHLHHRFTIVPWRWPDKTVIRSLVSAVEKMVAESIFQTAQRIDTLYDVFHCDPFAEILKQPIAE